MDLATARNLAIILLVFEVFIMVLIPGVILAFMVKGLNMGIKWLKEKGFPEVHRYAQIATDKTTEYSDKIVQPVVMAETKVSQARSMVSGLPRALRRRRGINKYV